MKLCAVFHMILKVWKEWETFNNTVIKTFRSWGSCCSGSCCWSCSSSCCCFWYGNLNFHNQWCNFFNYFFHLFLYDSDQDFNLFFLFLDFNNFWCLTWFNYSCYNLNWNCEPNGVTGWNGFMKFINSCCEQVACVGIFLFSFLFRKSKFSKQDKLYFIHS